MYDVEGSFKTVGGTDISVLVGTNTYQTAVNLLHNKRTKTSIDMNLKMLYGRILEKPTADVYAYNKGVSYANEDSLDESIVLDGIYRATIDRMIIKDKYAWIVDIKTRWSYWKQILPHYYANQVVYYTGIYDDMDLFQGKFPIDPVIVVTYGGELYEVSVPYLPEVYELFKVVAKEFHSYLDNDLPLPYSAIKKWQAEYSIYKHIYEDLKCRKISGLVVAPSMA